ncbi:MAG: hypothetical protein SFU98_13585 [Leptospiraceae bacterium]|nr:hypothetical protein [Leptospiraceae bacterium]
MTEFFAEIKAKLIELWTKSSETYELLKSIGVKLESIQKSLDAFFTVIPVEVILLFLFTTLVLVLLNSISPKTTRINLTIGVFIFAIIYLYIAHLLTNEWKFLRLLYICSFILVPAYIVEIFSFVKKMIFKQMYLQGKASGFLNDSIDDINQSYAEFLKSQHHFSKDPVLFLSNLESLKVKLEKLEATIKSKK